MFEQYQRVLTDSLMNIIKITTEKVAFDEMPSYQKLVIKNLQNKLNLDTTTPSDRLELLYTLIPIIGDYYNDKQNILLKHLQMTISYHEKNIDNPIYVENDAQMHTKDNLKYVECETQMHVTKQKNNS